MAISLRRVDRDWEVDKDVLASPSLPQWQPDSATLSGPSAASSPPAAAITKEVVA